MDAAEAFTYSAYSDNGANRSLELVKFLHEARTKVCTLKAMDSAAATGTLKYVRFLHAHQFQGCTTEAMDAVVSRWAGQARRKRKLHLQAVAKRFKNMPSLPPPRTTAAAFADFAMSAKSAKRSLESIKFLHGARTEGCTSKAMDSAAATGNLDVVRFLHEHRSEGCTTKAMDVAVSQRASHAAQARRQCDAVLEAPAERFKNMALSSACKRGCGELMRFLVAKSPRLLTLEALTDATRYRNIEALRILY
ncbi:hypothetical protein BDK51DRAFT_31894 [Blyttiomyces helicus]|uniref:Ankyrin repeat-containing domain protein n=1 Tax=Blyttiomyces helicus TaxID=388810 RepID=A0A4P9WL22_9FUNG|nr:hypothetical protein BDK51DRAFT_31894 [Blyttiomyces helicus]|eukprot:RKO93719.1 hypothetical protein BDK51DRAFT_31894 [Blyttiomyces helicus]